MSGNSFFVTGNITAGPSHTNLLQIIAQQNTQILSLQNLLTMVSSQATTFQSQITTLQSQVSTLQSQVSRCNANVSALQSQIATLQAVKAFGQLRTWKSASDSDCSILPGLNQPVFYLYEWPCLPRLSCQSDGHPEQCSRSWQRLAHSIWPRMAICRQSFCSLPSQHFRPDLLPIL